MPATAPLLDRFLVIVSNFFVVPLELLKPDTHLVNDLGGTSLDFIELACEVDAEFGLVVSDPLTRLVTPQHWVDCLQEMLDAEELTNTP